MPSKIEWLSGGDTWNPIIARVRSDAADIARAKGYASLVQIAINAQGKRGHHCEHAHAGCAHCYAETMNGRCLPNMGTGLPYDRRSRDLLQFELHEPTLMQPLRWKRGRHVFPCSMTDMFGEWVPDEFIDRVFAVMAACYQHRFIVLTKRPERMFDWMPRQIGMAASLLEDYIEESLGEYGALANWPLPNVILGTSVSDQATFDAAAPSMRALAAAGWHTVLSVEPLLGPVDLQKAGIGFNLVTGKMVRSWDCLNGRETCHDPVFGGGGAAPGISWVIVGGESGHGARPCNVEWIRSIVRQCREAGVPCFVKQLGADPRELNSRGNCRDLDCTHPDCGVIRWRLEDRKGSDMAEWPADLRVRELPEVLRG